MKWQKHKLNAEEKAILTAFESDKLRSIKNLANEKKRIQAIAKAHRIKNHPSSAAPSSQ